MSSKTVNVICPHCGENLVEPGDAYKDRTDVAAVCPGCGATFDKASLDALVKQIGEAFRDHVAEELRKLLK